MKRGKRMFKRNKDKKQKSKVSFNKSPLNFTHLGEVKGGHLNFTLTDDFEYLGDAKDVKKGIPNIDTLTKLLGALIVVDLESKEYMVIKVKDTDKLAIGLEFKALNSMTELVNFKKFIGQNIAISVNMEALRNIASKEQDENSNTDKV